MAKCDYCDAPDPHQDHPSHEDCKLCQSCYEGAMMEHYHADTFKEAVDREKRAGKEWWANYKMRASYRRTK